MSKADEIRDAITHTIVRNQKLGGVQMNPRAPVLHVLIESIAQVMAEREEKLERLMRAEFDRWGMG